MNYTEFVDRVTSLGMQKPTDPNWVAIIPAVIEYAEGRIYRELDALAQHGTYVFDLVAGNRDFDMAAATPKVLIPETVNVITPAATLPAAGSRRPLRPRHRDFMDAVYGTLAAGNGIPVYWAAYTNDIIRVGPTPDAAYKIEVVGKFQPDALTVSNPVTYLTATFPDLFVACAMVFVAGYERNFGAQAADPQQAQSWEAQYTTLKASALEQIERQKGSGLNMTAYRPPILNAG
jgi:hypothetical protein